MTLVAICLVISQRMRLSWHRCGDVAPQK